jgi:hypothetical protein
MHDQNTEKTAADTTGDGALNLTGPDSATEKSARVLKSRPNERAKAKGRFSARKREEGTG